MYCVWYYDRWLFLFYTCVNIVYTCSQTRGSYRVKPYVAADDMCSIARTLCGGSPVGVTRTRVRICSIGVASRRSQPSRRYARPFTSRSSAWGLDPLAGHVLMNMRALNERALFRSPICRSLARSVTRSHRIASLAPATDLMSRGSVTLARCGFTRDHVRTLAHAHAPANDKTICWCSSAWPINQRDRTMHRHPAAGEIKRIRVFPLFPLAG